MVMKTGAGVSYVVPVFNKAPWLPAVLAALKAQRGDFEREYIFVDDGSTDDSLAVLRQHTEGWDDVTIVTQENAGSAAATNAGIARTRLPYIKFCDADDLLAADATQLLLDALAADPDACLAYGARLWYRPGERPPIDAPLAVGTINRIDDPVRLAIRNSLFNPTQFLARTERVRAAGGCDERIIFSQEYSLTLRLSLQGPFLRLDTAIAWLLHEAEGRLSGNAGRQLQRVTLACANFLRDHPALPQAVRRFACRRAAGRAWRWQKRHRRASVLSPWFARYLVSFLPARENAPVFIEACASAFDDTGAPLPNAAVLA
jgi:glycosyltransferase involved in cell wall biosynthesis